MSDLISRRAFIGATAAAAVAGAGFSPLQHRPRRVPIVDTHVHCYAGPDDSRFPYHPQAPARPAAVATPEHLLDLMDATGVDYAVIVHPEPYQDDHRYLEHVLDVGAGRLKGTALVFADRPGSVDQLPGLVRRLPIVTVRIHAWIPDRIPPFGQPELYDLWALASDLGITVQLHFEPRWAGGFEPYIREFSDTAVVIDHVGRPFQGTAEEYETVLGFARYPNTIMKLSSSPLIGADDTPERNIHQILDQVVELWGVDRLIYGGGFSAAATAETYPAVRDRLGVLLSDLSEDDLAKVLGGNAARLFDFPG
jgi:predicted TIM-barrel fold metal-dependent hydrolase